jgi:hypothetical protein
LIPGDFTRFEIPILPSGLSPTEGNHFSRYVAPAYSFTRPVSVRRRHG